MAYHHLVQRVVVASVLAVAGCNSLLGVHDFEYRDAGGSGDLDGDIDGGPDVDSMVDGPPPPCNLQAWFGSLTAVTELNMTTFVDLVTDISDDGNTIYIESNRGGQGAQIYKSTWQGTAWSSPILATTVNAGDDVYSFTIANDNLTAVTSEVRSPATKSDLYLMTRANVSALFTQGAKITALSSDEGEGTQQLAPTGARLYFDSDRDDPGNRDLFQVDVVNIATPSFGTLTKLTMISSTAADTGPIVSSDQKTIFFSSTRVTANSGDVYVASRTDISQQFTGATPVTMWNTSDYEAPGALAPNECTIYVNRLVGGSDWQIYKATRPAL